MIKTFSEGISFGETTHLFFPDDSIPAKERMFVREEKKTISEYPGWAQKVLQQMHSFARTHSKGEFPVFLKEKIVGYLYVWTFDKSKKWNYKGSMIPEMEKSMKIRKQDSERNEPEGYSEQPAISQSEYYHPERGWY